MDKAQNTPDDPAPNETTQPTDETPSKNQPIDPDLGDEIANTADSLPTQDVMDIEGALACVASLTDVVAEHEAQEAAEIAEREAEAKEQIAYETRRNAHQFPEPELAVLGRGQIASVVPALLLIGFGAWLTFTLTTDADTPAPGIMLLILSGLFGFSLIAYWWASVRWSKGALFGGLTALALSGTSYFLSENTDPGPDGWPLLIAAFGIAILLTALLSPNERTRTLLVGVLILIVGIVGAAVTTEALDSDVTNTIEQLGPAVLAIALLLLLVPPLIRRRQA